MEKLNTIFYRFIWDKKPDKIKRIVLIQDYLDGGLKMINTDWHIKSLKSTWIRRLLKNDTALWTQMFDNVIGPIHNLTMLGPQWYGYLKSKTKNKFWYDGLESWFQISTKVAIDTKEQILNSPLWYNPNICNYDLYYPSWFQNGIVFVKDILNRNGNILTIDGLRNIYSLTVTNFLKYHKIKILVTRFLKKTSWFT